MEEMRILVTTDNHLGFAERDHIRGEDSFRAFEEVFKHARETQADGILICGDLFHEVSPSKYTIYRTMEILQRNILGDKPIHIECIDNGNFVDIQKRKRQPNYYNRHINIEIPVFAINGNHDEPSGHKGVTALDIFAEAGLINYFGALKGKTGNLVIRPIILRKKNIFLNLYGLGGIRDEAMAKLLAEERIIFEKAEKGTKLLVLHQTRCGVGRKGGLYVSEELLSKDLDLVIWGHMHQSEPMPVENYKMGFYTIQPGSTVQTSLCKAESGHKHCVLLKVTEEEWNTTAIRMESTRSLIFKTVIAQESNIEARIRAEMSSIVRQHTDEHRPLVRLRVEIDNSNTNTIIPKRVIEEFKDKIANPRDALRIIHKKKQVAVSRKEATGNANKNTQFTVEIENARILSENVFMQSILECVERENKTVISQRYDEIVQEVVKILKSHRWTDIEKEIEPAVQEVEKRHIYARAKARADSSPVAEERSLQIKKERESKEDKDIQPCPERAYASNYSSARDEYKYKKKRYKDNKKAEDIEISSSQAEEAEAASEQKSIAKRTENAKAEGSSCYISKAGINRGAYIDIDMEEKSRKANESKNSGDKNNKSEISRNVKEDRHRRSTENKTPAKREKVDYTFSSMWD